MELRAILKEIDKEIALLQHARALLTESQKPSRRAIQPKRRSPEVRKNMAEAQRKRWAKTKYSQKL